MCLPGHSIVFMSMQTETFQSLVYGLVQAAHNTGAVLLFGGYIASLLQKSSDHRGVVLWFVLSGWFIQGISGISFGIASLSLYGKFPDIGQVGTVMLLTKIICVGAGFLLTVFFAFRGKTWKKFFTGLVWNFSFLLAWVALIAAAFLRWFS